MRLGIIGSEEIRDLTLLSDLRPSGDKSSFPQIGTRSGSVNGTELTFVSRAGSDKPVACHNIDYVSVISRLKEEGVTHVLSTAMVGSLRRSLGVGHRTLLDQFLDFTRNRQFTMFDRGDDFVFSDMTNPFCPASNRLVLAAAATAEVHLGDAGCYVGVDGPRYETAAEVSMYAQMGGDVVGMTILPEAILAREAGMCYSTIAGIVNLGAGLGDPVLDTNDFRQHRSGHSAAFEAIVDVLTRAGTDELERCGCPHRATSQGA